MLMLLLSLLSCLNKCFRVSLAFFLFVCLFLMQHLITNIPVNPTNFFLQKINRNHIRMEQRLNPAIPSPYRSHHTISIAFTLELVITLSCLDDFKSLLASQLASSLCLATDSMQESYPLKTCQTTSLLC